MFILAVFKLIYQDSIYLQHILRDASKFQY